MKSLEILNQVASPTQSSVPDSSGSRRCGLLEVLWTADERLTSPYRWHYFYRYNATSTAVSTVPSFQGMNHAGILDQSGRFGFLPVRKRQRDIHLRWIRQMDTLSRTPISGRPLREWLRFEGISLWHFLPEMCYLGSAAELQETIELIEYLSELIDRYRPSRLVLAGSWKDHQRLVASLISQRYEIPIEGYSFQSPSPAIQTQPSQTNDAGDPFGALKAGQPRAVREYVSSLRGSRPAVAFGENPILLLSFPRAWTQTRDRGRMDVYYESFRSFFHERGFSPIRVELPYYFQIHEEQGVKSYIDSVIKASGDNWPTVFLDEYGSDAIQDFARQCRSGLEQTFQTLIRNPEFLRAFSWKGIDLISPLMSFWQSRFVDHLALRCIPAMMMARRILDAVRPRAVLAVYEIGYHSMAMIMEAHRRGIPSLGLQHAAILPEHEYYLHDDIVPRPDVSKGCQGRIVSTKTLVFGSDARQTLTRRGHYPPEAVVAIGCDWRHLHRGPLELPALSEFKTQWSPSGRKIVLVLGQTSLTYGILNQLVNTLSPAEYSVLIKLHPDDKSGQDYRRLLEEHGFEVCLVRDFLREAIQVADLVFALVFSTAVLECLYEGKTVFALRDLDLPYSVPWERLTKDLNSFEAADMTNPSLEQQAERTEILQTLGYGRSVSLRDFNLRLHSIFDEFEGKAHPDQDRTTPRSAAQPNCACQEDKRQADPIESLKISQPQKVFQNELYRRLEIHYDNYFQASGFPCSADREGPLIRQVQRISFQLSNLCNYATVHTRCPLYRQTDKQVLPSRVVRDTIDELAAIGFEGVIAFHIYNEPMIDPRLFSFIEYARHACPSARILILTNGFYLTQTIADELADLGIWNLVVSAYSQAEFERLIRLQVRVPYKVFEAKLDGRLDQYDRPPIDLKKPCWAPVRDLSIGPDGSVILCCLDWKQRHVFGNLTQETLSSVLSKESIASVYRDLLGGNRSLHLCRRCDWVR